MELLCYGCKGTPFPLSLQKNAEERCGRKQCVLSVSYLKSPKPQCLSAFQRSEIRVTTESQRSQNGVRTEAEPLNIGYCSRYTSPYTLNKIQKKQIKENLLNNL